MPLCTCHGKGMQKEALTVKEICSIKLKPFFIAVGGLIRF